VVAAGGPRPPVRSLKALVYERATRARLACVAADFPATVAILLRGAAEGDVRSFAQDLDTQQKKRWGDAVKPLLAVDAAPRPFSAWKESVAALDDLVQTAVLAGRMGVLDREKMLEWDTSGPALVRRMKDMVGRDFGRSDLSLADAAAEAHLVPTYASTLFKKVQGVGFLEYLTQVRLDAAKKLLAGTDLPVGEVAFRVGFPNQRYFSAVFRKALGTTPVGFRSGMDENQKN
jgi:AraC-like DNA-binding protein